MAFTSIVFVSYIAWKRSVLNGLILYFVNWVVTGAVFHNITPDFSDTFSMEAIVNIFIHIACAFLMGYIGTLSRRLQKEIEIRKEAEEQLKIHQNHLEDIVETRTRELEESKDRLHQMEKMESIGQLAGGVAHDYNNFLNIILGYSRLIVKNSSGKTGSSDYALKIEQTAKTASELTSQLLLFARKEKFSFEMIDINELVESSISLLSHSLRKNITIEFFAEHELPKIRGGRSQIQNALLNLAFNARDAMESSGTLTFTTTKETVTADYLQNNHIECETGEYVCIKVSDSGSGIPEETLKHIFEPFYTTKGRGKGTGMGLATVYGIARSHVGAVFVTSMVNRGTTFSLLFPSVR